MEKHDSSQKKEPWIIAADAVLAHFDTTLQGLTEAEARQRLERHGPPHRRRSRVRGRAFAGRREEKGR